MCSLFTRYVLFPLFHWVYPSPTEIGSVSEVRDILELGILTQKYSKELMVYVCNLTPRCQDQKKSCQCGELWITALREDKEISPPRHFQARVTSRNPLTRWYWTTTNLPLTNQPKPVWLNSSRMGNAVCHLSQAVVSDEIHLPAFDNISSYQTCICLSFPLNNFMITEEDCCVLQTWDGKADPAIGMWKVSEGSAKQRTIKPLSTRPLLWHEIT